MPHLNSVHEVIEHCKAHGIMLDLQFDGSSKPYKLIGLGKSIADDPLATYFGGHDPNGLSGTNSDITTPGEVLDQLNLAYQDENHDFRKVISETVERSFVYFDISDFSEHKAGQQALIINSFIALMHIDNWTNGMHHRWRNEIEASLCIGDGYIFVFRDAHCAMGFAAALATKIENKVANKSLPVEFHFRGSVHVGPVFRFFDFGRKDWNYVGEGINGGQRILAAMGKDIDDVIYISDRCKQKLLEFGFEDGHTANLLLALTSKGRHKDKHNKLWRVHQLNHQTADNGT